MVPQLLNAEGEKLTILGGHDGIHFSTCDRVAILDCTMKTGDDRPLRSISFPSASIPSKNTCQIAGV